MARGPYRENRRDEIAAIVGKAIAASITLEQLADRAGISIRTLRRMRRTGLAFRRQVVALRMALRTLEKERRAAGELFPGAGEERAVPRATAKSGVSP